MFVEELIAHREITIYEDFLNSNAFAGGLTQQISGTGAGVSIITNPVPGIQGLAQLSTGTTATGRAAIAAATNSLHNLADARPIKVETAFDIPTLSNGTESFSIRGGLLNSISAEPTNGVYFRALAADTTLFAVTRNNSVETAVNTNVTLVAGQLYKTAFRIDAGVATFFIGGVQVAQISTNLPSTVSRPMGFIPMAIIKSLGTVSRTVRVDWCYLNMGIR